MKKEEQTQNRQQLKEDDTENKKIETSSENNKPEEITLEKNTEMERNFKATKPQKHNRKR